MAGCATARSRAGGIDGVHWTGMKIDGFVIGKIDRLVALKTQRVGFGRLGQRQRLMDKMAAGTRYGFGQCVPAL